MGKHVEAFRADLRDRTSKGLFGRTIYPQVDTSLYLNARIRDEQDKARTAEALAAATENAALKIIGRYDPKAASDFYQEVQLLKERYSNE